MRWKRGTALEGLDSPMTRVLLLSLSQGRKICRAGRLSESRMTYMKFDFYSQRARVLPVYLTMAPLVLLFMTLLPEGLSLPVGGVSAIVLLPLSFLASQFGADFGKRLEKHLWHTWGGPPATRFLRHSNTEFNEVTRSRIHSRLRALGLTVPSREEQVSDPPGADVCFESCVEELIRRTRDPKRFPLVLKALTDYGFRRNLLGLKPVGILLTILSLGVSTGHIYTLWHASHQVRPVAVVASVGVLALLLIWLTWVNDETVHLAGKRYARFLLEAAPDPNQPMPTIHFLNVKGGDCSIIQHYSGHVSVLDVCNAKPVETFAEAISTALAKVDKGVAGNFQQKNYPVNPVSYLGDHGITNAFRYVQTHPDMDHMDGIEVFFREFGPANLWDTDNTKELPSSSWQGSPYREEDWKFYKRLRDTKPAQSPRRLTLMSGAGGQFWNVGADGSSGGDGLHILAPTQQLIDAANQAAEEYHQSSYVILYKTGENRIIFGGDSHDETWEHILKHHTSDAANIDLLIAPHHGRKSGRSYDFLDTLRPTLTFFGNARSEHLAYSAWNSRGLSIVTNNQANCMVVDASSKPMELYVTHEHYARRVNQGTFFSDAFKAWYVGPINKGLIP